MYWLLLLAKYFGVNSEKWTRRCVDMGNRYFYGRFKSIPYQERLLFLAFCLRHSQCPASITPEHGLLCMDTCTLCRIAEIKREAFKLGYLGVYVVPSSRLIRNKGLMPSKEFVWKKIEEHRPRGALGVICLQDLKRKYMSEGRLCRKGVITPSGSVVTPQGLLLASNNCRKNSVDWERLERLMVVQ